jgi:hypothetical protein
VSTLVERLDLPTALPYARSRRDTETETVRFAQGLPRWNARTACYQEGRL